MTLTRLNAGMALAVFVSGLAAGLGLRQHALEDLRLENKGLRALSEQLTRLCADLRATQPQASRSGVTNLAEAVVVDCAVDCGAVSHCASGFLFGLSDDGLEPPDSAVLPLKIRLHRTKLSLAKAQAARLKSLGFQLQVVVSDDWGYGQAHPGDKGDWSRWETFLRHQVEIARQARLQLQFDIWNEPDYRVFWQRTPEQFLETWTRAYHAIWGDERNHNLDGILAGSAPRGQWWVYRRYAELRGQLLGSTPSASADLAAVADLDSKKLRMLLGRRGNIGLHVEVRLEHLEALPFLKNQEQVEVQVEQIPDNDGAVVTELPIVLRQMATVVDGRAKFVIPWLSPRDACTAQISPGDGVGSMRPRRAQGSASPL